MFGPAHRAAHLEAVDARQHDVEQQQVGADGRHPLQRHLAGRRDVDHVAFEDEVVADHPRQRRIVLDDENALLHPASLAGSSSATGVPAMEGKFLREGYNRRESLGTGSAFGVVVAPDNRWVYVADGSNERVAIIDRATLEVIGTIGRPGSNAGEFYHLHSISIDPQGNVITGESQGYRVRRFLFKGVPNSGTR